MRQPIISAMKMRKRLRRNKQNFDLIKYEDKSSYFFNAKPLYKSRTQFAVSQNTSFSRSKGLNFQFMQKNRVERESGL